MSGFGQLQETQLAHMRPGQPVEIKVDAYGRTWKAHVTNTGAGAGSVFSLLPPENATGKLCESSAEGACAHRFRSHPWTRLQCRRTAEAGLVRLSLK